MQAKGPEPLHGFLGIVAAGNRVQDSPAVQLLDDLVHAWFQGDGGIFQKHAVPDRVIQVPYDALDVWL